MFERYINDVYIHSFMFYLTNSLISGICLPVLHIHFLLHNLALTIPYKTVSIPYKTVSYLNTQNWTHTYHC
jgi:hypothetical protein